MDRGLENKHTVIEKWTHRNKEVQETQTDDESEEDDGTPLGTTQRKRAPVAGRARSSLLSLKQQQQNLRLTNIKKKNQRICRRKQRRCTVYLLCPFT